MQVEWISGVPATDVAAVVVSFCRRAATILALPEKACFTIGQISTGWGATVLGGRWTGTINLDHNLRVREVVSVLSHELIHLHQIHTGRLGGTPSGGILWGGELYTDIDGLSYQDYCRLPWEAEAYAKQNWLLEQVLQ